MFNLQSLNDLSVLAESVELECKLAQGQDGKGEVPKDFWPTYSAMANSHGGVVLLGVREKSGQFSLAGIENVTKVRADLFNTLNNRAKVSCNLLTDADVLVHQIDGKNIIVIKIPHASRKQKPVFLNNQPFGNTYRRLHEGDRHCDEAIVKRMLAEQLEDERDARILPGFGLDDIDAESLRVYRQMLRDRTPTHPFLEQDDAQLLQSLRGWRRDRQTGEQGLTIAGLLMFGKHQAILDALPHYQIDYQERPEAKTELRWVDRLVPDGTWSGNIFEFFRRVYRKLVTDLKVPFLLIDGQRQEDTQVHVALREALVNALVHADYTGTLSVLVVKRPDMFGFRNPGGLRLPLEQVIRGGDSDCRNRILHQMFLLIGLGERAGSGIPKIYSGWRSQHWRPPSLYVKDEPEQTLLELRMLDLLPEQILAQLKLRFGDSFGKLDHTERLILATVAIERVVSHNRLLEICEAHPHDLSQHLSHLVRDGFLNSDGRSRGMVYFLPGDQLPTPEQVFEGPLPLIPASSEHSAPSSEHLSASSEHLTVTFEYSQVANRDHRGCVVSEHLDAPVIDSLEALDPVFRKQLAAIADEPQAKQKLPKDRMRLVILELCRGHFMTLSVIAQLVNRNPDALRQQYLNEMVRNRQIVMAFPSKRTHERQAYRSISAD